MPELLSIDNFKGMVTDVADGKQPQGTCKEIKNMVYDRDYGSLTTRFTYETGLARPTGVSTLSSWLSFPVTYPSATDHHLWFTEDGIYQYNYWHNSSTLTNGWVLVTESKDLSSISSGDVTVNASPTNTIVIDNADTTWGLSTTNNYYKNWIFQGTGGNTATYFVKSYSFASHTATFTLDNVLTIDWAVIPDYKLFRYFHKDYSFTPAFTYPAGYSTETAIRWSGGGGSTTGLKNIKSGYLDKVFFNNSGTTHTFTGTYIDQAECASPSASLLTSLSVANVDTNIIQNEADSSFIDTGTNWAVNGSTTTQSPSIKLATFGLYDSFVGLSITNTVDGYLASTGTYTNDYVKLTSSYCANLSATTTYTLRVKAYAFGGDNRRGAIVVKVVGNSTYTSPRLEFTNISDPAINNADASVEVKWTFTTAGGDTADPEIPIYQTGIAEGYANTIFIDGIFISTSTTPEIKNGYTYKLWASTVYDKTQESELTYLDSEYVTNKYGKLSYEINQKLGALNKFATGFRLYLSEEEGNTTGTTTTTTAPRYLVKSIAIDNDATATWTFDTSAGRYEYVDTITGADWLNRGVTWEQKTQRTASASTTCSYFLAKQASGRVFLADDYDYADGRLYINRVRYTGFNGDGASTPDIFPNIQDVFITTITAGQSQEIRNIAEYDGDLIILKKSSILRLDTSNPDPFTWTIRLIKNGVGTRSSKGAYKFDKGLFFTDLYSAYLYDGYQVRDVLKGRWRNRYQSLVTTDAIAISQIVWYNPVNDTISIAYDTVTSSSIARNFYEFNTDSWLPVLNQNSANYEINNLVITSDGVIHFAPTSVGANAWKIATTVQANTVNVVIDTGYYGMPIGKLAEPKWIYVLAQLPNTSEMTVTLYGDNTTTLGQGVFTSASNEIRLYKFQTILDYQHRMLKVYIVQNGTVAPSTKEFKVIRVLVDGNLVDEKTDITETVTVT